MTCTSGKLLLMIVYKVTFNVVFVRLTQCRNMWHVHYDHFLGQNKILFICFQGMYFTFSTSSYSQAAASWDELFMIWTISLPLSETVVRLWTERIRIKVSICFYLIYHQVTFCWCFLFFVQHRQTNYPLYGKFSASAGPIECTVGAVENGLF